jgi:hypothetical protein
VVALRGIKVGGSSLRGNRLQPKMCHIVAHLAMFVGRRRGAVFPHFVAQMHFPLFPDRFLVRSAIHKFFSKILFKTLVSRRLQKRGQENQFFTRLEKCLCRESRPLHTFAASNFDFAHNQIFAAYGTTCYN